jgi:oxaloacetate decarboxylase beta subunit
MNLLANIGEIFLNLWKSSGIANGSWQNYVMILISFVLFYLAIVKKFEPLLLLPIAFGMFLINLPGAYDVLWGTYKEGVAHTYENVENRGLLWYLFFGVQNVIYPPLIFLGIGAMTDFGPLISNPKSMLIGAAAQFGIFLTLIGAVVLGFDLAAACSIAIIGGADGPTAIYVTQSLAKFTDKDLLSAIAIAAYSYMALIPIIQKPLMRLLVPKKERAIKMKPLRTVSKLEKIIFPIVVTLVVGCLLPDAVPLLGMLMLGNLLKESGVCDRLSSQAQNGLMNTITIFLGISVGCKAYGGTFLQVETLMIIGLGLVAFCFGTVGGLLMGRLMCKLSKGKINPLIGSAGVSAVPMAARISEDVGREEDPSNHLLMHAMGPNVAGVIGSAIAAGFLLSLF